jgi:putative oxidoreductase
MPISHTPVAVRADEYPIHPVIHSRFRSHLPNIALTLLRIVTGLMFMQHGAQKFWGLGLAPDAPAMPSPHPFTQVWFAAVLELVGGALITLGLFTRVTAFILAGEMAFAYFMVHARRAFFPIENRGELAALYCFVFLTFAAIGCVRFGLDRLFFHRREHVESEDIDAREEVVVGRRQ